MLALVSALNPQTPGRARPAAVGGGAPPNMPPLLSGAAASFLSARHSGAFPFHLKIERVIEGKQPCSHDTAALQLFAAAHIECQTALEPGARHFRGRPGIARRRGAGRTRPGQPRYFGAPLPILRRAAWRAARNLSSRSPPPLSMFGMTIPSARAAALAPARHSRPALLLPHAAHGGARPRRARGRRPLSGSHERTSEMPTVDIPAARGGCVRRPPKAGQFERRPLKMRSRTCPSTRSAIFFAGT